MIAINDPLLKTKLNKYASGKEDLAGKDFWNKMPAEDDIAMTDELATGMEEPMGSNPMEQAEMMKPVFDSWTADDKLAYLAGIFGTPATQAEIIPAPMPIEEVSPMV